MNKQAFDAVIKLAEQGLAADAYAVKRQFTGKTASTALTRRIAKGLLSPPSIERAARAMPVGQIRQVRQPQIPGLPDGSYGKFNLADTVVGNWGPGRYAGIAVRKLPIRHEIGGPVGYYDGMKSLVSSLNRQMRKDIRRIAPTDVVSADALALLRAKHERSLDRGMKAPDRQYERRKHVQQLRKAELANAKSKMLRQKYYASAPHRSMIAPVIDTGPKGLFQRVADAAISGGRDNATNRARYFLTDLHQNNFGPKGQMFDVTARGGRPELFPPAARLPPEDTLHKFISPHESHVRRHWLAKR